MFVNLSRRVWIIFCLNFKTFFWRYMLSLNLPLHINVSNVFPKRTIIFVAGLRIISPHLRHSEQVCSIVSGLIFSIFQRNLLKNLLDHAGEMSVVFIFDMCNVYKFLLMMGCISSTDIRKRR